MKRQLLAEQWDEYVRACFSPGIGPNQVRDTRHAFYAGAWAIFLGIVVPLGADKTVLEDLDQELLEYEESLENKGVYNVAR